MRRSKQRRRKCVRLCASDGASDERLSRPSLQHTPAASSLRLLLLLRSPTGTGSQGGKGNVELDLLSVHVACLSFIASCVER
jgi:hypothetical protein